MAMKAEHYLEIKNLTVDYLHQGEKVSALDGVNLFLDQGEMGVIIGPSGCGKSTLINVLAGLNPHYLGWAEIDGKTPVSGGETSLILQDYGLLPWKTVWENVMLGLRFRKKELGEMQQRVEAMLRKMDLLQLAERFPSQLSGGQRQRVAIARSLVLEPKLLLMDEPFSSLDALTREEIQDFLLAIWQETHLTTLLITHNIEEAVFLGQKIFVMSACPGRIMEKVENPLAGNNDLRGKVQFLEMATYLRSLLHQPREGRCSGND
ncbi:MAG: ABC transporter ATP-binding protein [Dehalobacterium sp.]|jgi:taurine transport system ATP-binding protein